MTKLTRQLPWTLMRVLSRNYCMPLCLSRTVRTVCTEYSVQAIVGLDLQDCFISAPSMTGMSCGRPAPASVTLRHGPHLAPDTQPNQRW